MWVWVCVWVGVEQVVAMSVGRTRHVARTPPLPPPPLPVREIERIRSHTKARRN